MFIIKLCFDTTSACDGRIDGRTEML